MLNNKPIIALDFESRQKTEEFLRLFEGQNAAIKAGMELFYREGPSYIADLKDRGFELFLDLKLHDIPHTVYRAMKGLASLGADMVNVHAAGGRAMMESALEGLEAGTPAGKQRPLLIAVTQLTSTTEEQMRSEQLVSAALEESVLHYALLAKQSGLDGTVCSALEASDIASAAGKEFLRITPGIRLDGDRTNDQKRVVTPARARELGATSIVVGRSVTQAEDPIAAYRRILTEWGNK